MFKFSSKTQVDRIFKIKELYKIMKVDKKVKVEAACIETVKLAKVISAGTLNMKSDENCKEIYIFQMVLKEKLVPINFIKSLDSSIKLHTYFVLQYGEQVNELCILREVQGEIIKFGKIYESQWGKEVLKELPYCRNISDIYRSLVFELVPIVPRENEELIGFIERYEQAQKLKKDIAALERKAYQEKQPRKKFDIGRDIRSLQQKLKELEG